MPAPLCRSIVSGRAARHADPDHDRRAALGHRHRRHGPAGAAPMSSPSPGRAVEAAGDVDTLLLDKTGTITFGNRMADEFMPLPGVDRAGAGRGGAARLARRRDAGRQVDRRARRAELRPRARLDGADRRVHPVHRPDPHARRRPRRRRDGPQGRVDAMPVRAWCRRTASIRSAHSASSRRDRPHRRHAAGRRRATASAGRHPPEGHRQAGHPRALRRAAPDGHPHRDDHRRQPADRRGHRRRGRRRRLPRRGDAGGEAGADPRASRPTAGWSRCAATAPTTRRRSPRPMSAWP